MGGCDSRAVPRPGLGSSELGAGGGQTAMLLLPLDVRVLGMCLFCDRAPVLFVTTSMTTTELWCCAVTELHMTTHTLRDRNRDQASVLHSIYLELCVTGGSTATAIETATAGPLCCTLTDPLPP
ncbi:hypothetical protein AAFF_G00004160 [Aldrovandia affinis]|uniref:Uncharacterized protein n=1 Tax=Aldrovandia affinis TaxID=143900 RepID=A0AAD7X3E7_9TELE|nr:hypothetical protein AAFF_G00004160 [Aldrovandia affinis]